MHNLRHIAVPTAILLLLLAVPGFSGAQEGSPDAVEQHLAEAEVALQDDDYLKAAMELRRAAELGDDPQVAQHATRTAFGFGFNEEALRSANRWLELDVESDEARVYVAQLQLRLGEIKMARQSFEALMARGEQSGGQKLLSLLPLFAEEDAELVDKLVRSLAEPYPDSAAAHYAAAMTALSANAAAHARQRAQRATQLDPEWLNPKLLYARALLLAGEEEEAVDYVARIIGDDPSPDPDARLELALIYMTLGRDEDALSQVDQVLLEQSGRFDALRLGAIINFRLNRLDESWDDFEMLLSSGRYTMEARYYLGRIADFRDETDRAIRYYSLVERGPHVVMSQRRAGALIAFRKDQPERALKQLEDFASEHPQYAVDMALAKAQLLASMERYDEALPAYDKVAEFRPDAENVALGRAELLLRMGQLDDALSGYRAAVKRWPNSAMSLNALGYTLADRTEEYREAEKLIRKALELEPESAAIIDSLGWVLFKRGRFDEALEQLEIAYERFPDPEVAAHLVEVLVALKSREEAMELLLKAEERSPDSPLLRDVRERVFPDSGQE
jgi:tetratricopeptide (TPR) repeat protein